MPLWRAPKTATTTTTTTTTSGGETRSATEPATKAIGDTWLELDSLNIPLYGFAWRWDGLSWLSPEQVIDWGINNFANRQDYCIDCNPAFNYFFKEIRATSVTGYVQTTDHHWEFQLISVDRDSGFVMIYNLHTTGNLAKWTRQKALILNRFDVAANNTYLFDLIADRKNSPGNLFAAVRLIYHFSRIP